MVNIRCAICSRDFDAGDEVNATKCGHMFHLSCLNFFLKRSAQCPVCDQSLRQEDSHRVYFDTPGGNVLIRKNGTERSKPTITNGSGTVISCNEYQPREYNLGLNLNWRGAPGPSSQHPSITK